MDLRPSILDDLGILATLSWFCREFQKTYADIQIQQNITVEEDHIQRSLKTAIFRITQEAMNNIAKHSRASVIHLALTKDDHLLYLEIRDNGRGFNVKQTLVSDTEGRGLGLASMQERAELFGGNFQLISEEGQGTLIRAVWPLEVPIHKNRG